MQTLIFDALHAAGYRWDVLHLNDVPHYVVYRKDGSVIAESNCLNVLNQYILSNYVGWENN